MLDCIWDCIDVSSPHTYKLPVPPHLLQDTDYIKISRYPLKIDSDDEKFLDVYGTYPVEIHESTIEGAGRGVFASIFLPKGMTIAVYGCSVVPRFSRKHGDFVYAMEYDSNYTMLGFSNPTSKCGVAQLLNDRFHPITEKDFEGYSSKNSESEYNVDAYRKNPYLFITTRDVYEGEELFFQYGEDYWRYFNKYYATECGGRIRGSDCLE